MRFVSFESTCEAPRHQDTGCVFEAFQICLCLYFFFNSTRPKSATEKIKNFILKFPSLHQVFPNYNVRQGGRFLSYQVIVIAQIFREMLNITTFTSVIKIWHTHLWISYLDDKAFAQDANADRMWSETTSVVIGSQPGGNAKSLERDRNLSSEVKLNLTSPLPAGRCDEQRDSRQEKWSNDTRPCLLMFTY